MIEIIEPKEIIEKIIIREQVKNIRMMKNGKPKIYQNLT